MELSNELARMLAASAATSVLPKEIQADMLQELKAGTFGADMPAELRESLMRALEAGEVMGGALDLGSMLGKKPERVVIGKLTEAEQLKVRELEQLSDQAQRAHKAYHAAVKRLEASDEEFFLALTDRLGVPSGMDLDVKRSTMEIMAIRKDAERAGLVGQEAASSEA